MQKLRPDAGVPIADCSTFKRGLVEIGPYVGGIGSAPLGPVAGVSHFEELDCWKLASELKRALLAICRRAHASGDFEFVRQARQSARSAPANIAEGFGRRTHRDFAHFLDIARGSLMETENLLQEALDSNYISSSEYAALRSLTKRATGATGALQRYLRSHPDP